MPIRIRKGTVSTVPTGEDDASSSLPKAEAKAKPQRAIVLWRIRLDRFIHTPLTLRFGLRQCGRVLKTFGIGMAEAMPLQKRTQRLRTAHGRPGQAGQVAVQATPPLRSGL